MKKKRKLRLPLANLIGLWACIFALGTLPMFSLVDLGLSMEWAVVITSMILATLVVVMFAIKINEE